MLMIIAPLLSLPLLPNPCFITTSFILFSFPLTFIYLTNPYPWTLAFSSLFSIDLMSSSLVLLTLWITSLMILASYKIKQSHNLSKKIITLSLLLSIFLILVFSSSNLILFYILLSAH